MMTLLVLMLLLLIVYLLWRIQYLLTAHSQDSADFRQQLAQLRTELRRQLPPQEGSAAAMDTRPSVEKSRAEKSLAAAPNAKKVSATTRVSDEALTEATARININTVTKNGLQRLPKVGATCAQRVIDARPFKSLEQLDALPGLTQQQRDSLKSHLTV